MWKKLLLLLLILIVTTIIIYKFFGLTPSVVCAGLILLAFIIINQPVKEIKVGPFRIILERAHSFIRNHTQKIPSLIIGKGNNYEETNTYKSGILHRTFWVGVKNNSEDFLTNCRLYLDHTLSNGSLGTILLAETFDVAPKKERFIKVASYGEAIDKKLNGDPCITLCMVSRGFFAYENMPSIDKEHIITLRLQAFEDIVIKTNCRLWVEIKTGRLRFKQA